MGINFSMTILTNTIVLYMMRYLNLQSYIAGGNYKYLIFRGDNWIYTSPNINKQNRVPKSYRPCELTFKHSFYTTDF